MEKKLLGYPWVSFLGLFCFCFCFLLVFVGGGGWSAFWFWFLLHPTCYQGNWISIMKLMRTESQTAPPPPAGCAHAPAQVPTRG